jgi:hypothetical protein
VPWGRQQKRAAGRESHDQAEDPEAATASGYGLSLPTFRGERHSYCCLGGVISAQLVTSRYGTVAWFIGSFSTRVL